jgi:hypothetical protein
MNTYTQRELLDWFDEMVKEHKLEEVGWLVIREMIVKQIVRDENGI